MSLHLKVIAGPDLGKRFPIPPTGSLSVGRGGDVDTQLTDTRVSRLHFRVTASAGAVRIQDLGSKTGTIVNDLRVGVEQSLRLGDVIVVGDTYLQLVTDDPADQTDLQPVLRPPTHQGMPVPTRPTPPPVVTPSRPSAQSKSNRPAVTRVASTQDLMALINTKLGSFTIGPVLGVGKTGVVFRALDTRDRGEVALKVFLPDFSQNEEEVQRFIRAAKTIKPLRYLHLVDIYSAGRTDGYCWLSMELVEGPSVAWFVQQAATDNFDLHLGLRVLVGVTRALIFLHNHQVLHRNLTPENLLVSQADGLVKVGDVITAKAQDGTLAQDVTSEGHVVGDLRYLAPERTHQGGADGDERSDLYSLGAVVYAVLTGRPPLEGHNSTDTITKIREMMPPLPRTIEPRVPIALENVVMRLLAKNPDHRYDDATALLRGLVAHRLME